MMKSVNQSYRSPKAQNVHPNGKNQSGDSEFVTFVHDT